MSVVLTEKDLRLLDANCGEFVKTSQGKFRFPEWPDEQTGRFDGEKGAMYDFEVVVEDEEGNAYMAEGGYYTATSGYHWNYDLRFYFIDNYDDDGDEEEYDEKYDYSEEQLERITDYLYSASVRDLIERVLCTIEYQDFDFLFEHDEDEEE